MPVLKSRPAAAVLTAAIVALTLSTAFIHLGLGGLLFTMNGLGYTALAAAIVVGSVAADPLIARFSWLPRVGLAGYTAVTIVGYLVMGPYFTLGYIAKAIEVGILVLLAIDVVRVYGGVRGLVHAARASIVSLVPASRQPAD